MKNVIKSRIINNIFAVECPYNTLVTDKFKKLNGTWNKDLQAWVFDKLAAEYVNKILIKYFGVAEGKFDFCKLTVKNFSKTQHLGSINFCGFPIFRAYDRDSGADVCDNVLLIDGEIDSGGSRAYWLTRCEDAEFVYLYFPVAMLNMKSIKDLGDDVEIEYIENLNK